MRPFSNLASMKAVPGACMRQKIMDSHIEFSQTICKWLDHTYDSLTLAGGRFIPKSEWVSGRYARVYIRFQYKRINRKQAFCIVLANMGSTAPGSTRVVIDAMQAFCAKHGLVFYVENVIHPKMEHLCKAYNLELEPEHTDFGLPCYYKVFT